MRRVLGRDHRNTLILSGNLAASLLRQGDYAEALEIQHEVIVQQTRLLGAEHESTLTLAVNLVVPLRECGKKTECEQRLRDARWLCPGARSTRLTSQHIVCFRSFVRSVSQRDGPPGPFTAD